MKLLFSTIFAFFFVLSLSSCNEAKKEEVDKVKIGYLAIAGSLPTFVAQDNDIFHNNGLAVELVQFNTSNEIAIAATSGRIDVIGLGATNAVIDASVTASKPMQIFSTIGYVKADGTRKSTDSLIVTKDVTFESLKGKTIAFFPGSVSRVFAELILPKYGLTISDINYVEMAPPAWNSAMDTGVIDGVHAVEPFVQILANNDNYKVLIDGYLAEVMSEVPLSGSWFVKGNLTSDQEQAVYESYQQSLDLIQNDPSLALKSFESYTKMPEGLYSGIGLNQWSLVNEPGTRETIKEFITILEKAGAIKAIPEDYIWQPK